MNLILPGSARSPGGVHGNPLQYSYLENPMGRGAWQTTVRGVAKSQTRLKRLSRHLPFLPWAVTGLSTVYREPLGARPHVDRSKEGKVAGPVFGVSLQASPRPGWEDVSWDPTLLRQQRRRSHQHRRAGGWSADCHRQSTTVSRWLPCFWELSSGPQRGRGKWQEAKWPAPGEWLGRCQREGTPGRPCPAG